jgi:hypothetical protein
MKKRIGKYLLNKQLKDRTRNQLFLGMKKSKRIGILFDATTYDNYLVISKLSKQLSQSGKTVTALGYSHSKNKDDRYISDMYHGFICKRDFNWMYKTRDEFTTSFINTPFDILLVISDGAYFPITYIGHLSNAHFKVSRKYLSDEIFDFMIDFPTRQPSFSEQIEQMLHYLNMLTGSEKHEPVFA